MIKKRSKKQEFEDYKLATYEIMAELIEELHDTRNTYYTELLIRAMRHIELTDDDIRSYFKGNIIL